MLKARDVMITDVYMISSSSSVLETLKLFAEKNISGGPIVDNNRQLVGYVSDGDIMRQLGKHTDPTGGYVGWAAINSFYWTAFTARELNPDFDQFKDNVQLLLKRNVLEIGTKKVICINPDDDLVDVAQLLSQRKIKKVPVVEGSQVVGIVSRGDIVRSVVKKFIETHA